VNKDESFIKRWDCDSGIDLGISLNQVHEVAAIGKLLINKISSSNDVYEGVYMEERRGTFVPPCWASQN
jgi:hypothetical protein